MTDEQNTTKGKLDKLSSQEEKILRLLREEQRLAKDKFPLAFALAATFGAAATLSGINKIIDRSWLHDNPLTLIAIGLAILFITGAAYKKLG
jgi:hypothetical protein